MILPILNSYNNKVDTINICVKFGKMGNWACQGETQTSAKQKLNMNVFTMVIWYDTTVIKSLILVSGVNKE